MLLADEEPSVPNREIRRAGSVPLLASTGFAMAPQFGSAPNIHMLGLAAINDQPGAASEEGTSQVVLPPVTPPALVIPKLRRSGRVHSKPDRFSPY